MTPEFIKRLQRKWNLKSVGQVGVVLLVFTCTGFSVMFLKRPITDWIYSDPEAAKYAWGMGFHWYESWAGGEPMFDNVAKVYEDYPDKKLMFTEGCNENFDVSKYQFWPNAERYGKSMINDFNNGTVAWTDWNILLDHNGGPNHVGTVTSS